MWGKKKGRKGLSSVKKYFPLNIWNHLRSPVLVRAQQWKPAVPCRSGLAFGPGLLRSVTILWIVTMGRALCLLLENYTLALWFSVLEYNSQTTLNVGHFQTIQERASLVLFEKASFLIGVYWVIFLDEGKFCDVLCCLCPWQGGGVIVG